MFFFVLDIYDKYGLVHSFLMPDEYDIFVQ